MRFGESSNVVALLLSVDVDVGTDASLVLCWPIDGKFSVLRITSLLSWRSLGSFELSEASSCLSFPAVSFRFVFVLFVLVD